MPKTHVIAIDHHPRSSARIEFDIDFATGEITDFQAAGINPEYAMRQLTELANSDTAHFAWQQSYPTPDPLHIPRSLCWQLMSRGWVLEGELATLPWPVIAPLPPGAIA